MVQCVCAQYHCFKKIPPGWNFGDIRCVYYIPGRDLPGSRPTVFLHEIMPGKSLENVLARVQREKLKNISDHRFKNI